MILLLKQLRTNFVSGLEIFLWYIYLLMLVSVSFVGERYDSFSWAPEASYLYLFCCFYLALLLLGANYNKQAIRLSCTGLITLGILLIWLLAQFFWPTFLSIRNDFLSSAPNWFDQEFLLGISGSQKAKSIFFANIYVFSWMLLSLAIITNRIRVKQLLICLTLIGLSHALIGLYAKLNSLMLVDKQMLDGHFNAARGMFVNRNHFAGLISLSLIGVITYFSKSLMSKQGSSRPLVVILDLVLSPKVLVVVIGAISFIAIILSQSRAGVFGLVSAFFLVITFVSFFDKRIEKKFRIMSFLILFLIGLYLLFGQDLMTRMNADGFTLGERVVQWNITLQAIVDAPLMGYGAGSYATVFQIYREHTDLRQVIFDQSHNEYLQLWLEQGLVGLILFIIFIVMALKSAFSSYKVTSSTLVASVMIGALVVLLSALAQSLVDFNLQIINIRVFFFVIIALMYATTASTAKN